MDTNIVVVVVISLFAVIVITIFIIYHQCTKANTKGEIGLRLDVSNDKLPIVPSLWIEDVTAQKGIVQATNEIGHGVTLRRVQTGTDIEASNKQPNKDSSLKNIAPVGFLAIGATFDQVNVGHDINVQVGAVATNNTTVNPGDGAYIARNIHFDGAFIGRDRNKKGEEKAQLSLPLSFKTTLVEEKIKPDRSSCARISFCC
jgi:hypothetical protein